MGKFFSILFNGLTFALKPWVLFGILVPIVFFIFHPVDPMVVLGIAVMAVVIYYTNKWRKEMPAAQKATEEAEAAGVKFVEVHPTDEDKESPLKRYKNKFYPALWSALLSACMLSCSYQIIHRNTSKPATALSTPVPSENSEGGRTVAAADEDTSTVWTTSNIQMAHIDDPDAYVTNSDSLLTPETVAMMNAKLKELDSIVGVEPAVVICRKVAEGDSYRTAVDLVNKYGIGKKDTGRGICVVVAYDQHKYTIAPSRALESVLTDIECSQLGRTYLAPFLQKEQPDSAMLNLTAALYETISRHLAAEDDTTPFYKLKSDGLFSGDTGMMMLIILVMCFLFGYYDDKNKWQKPVKQLAKVADTPEEPQKKKEEEPKKTQMPHQEPPRRGSYGGGGSSGGGGATGGW